MAPPISLHNIYSKIDGVLPPLANSLECPIKNRHLRLPARHAVAKALKHGLLVRPATCSACTARGRIQAHHDDYAEPLVVQWWCLSCHRKYHTALARVFPELKTPRTPRPKPAPLGIDPHESATWLPTLTLEQVAAIYQRSVWAMRKACSQNRFIPMPFQTRPYRWRKSAIVRDLDGVRPSSSLRRVG